MNRLLLLVLVLCCLALAAPPLPKRVKHVKPPTKGDGAAALLVKPQLLPAFVWLELDWDYTGPTNGVLFNVYQRQPSSGWAVLASVQSTRYQFPVSGGPNSVFFTVTASNTVTGHESQAP